MPYLATVAVSQPLKACRSVTKEEITARGLPPLVSRNFRSLKLLPYRGEGTCCCVACRCLENPKTLPLVAWNGTCGIHPKPAAEHVGRSRVTLGLICFFPATTDQVANLLTAQAAYNCAFIISGSFAIRIRGMPDRPEQIAVGEGTRNVKRMKRK